MWRSARVKEPTVELRFVTLALKRLWWLPVIFGLIGIVVGGRLTASDGEEFEATALVLVQPSDDSISPAQVTAPDRFVASQISLLESNLISEAVAAELGGDETALTVSRSLEFEQREQSDVVEIIATTSEAERSQAIAQNTADAYIAELESRVESLFAPEQNELTRDLEVIDAGLLRVNEQLSIAAQPFLDQLGDESPIPVPDIQVLDPAAATERSTLLAERATARARLDALELATANAVNTELIQPAVVPEEPLANALAPLRYAVALVFALLGVAVALIVTRFSKVVLDERDIETGLRRPIEARLPRSKSLTGDLNNALTVNSAETAVTSALDRLASRIELSTEIRGARIVGVGGSQAHSGSSTVATALAARFAERGNRTVLVDADSIDARITKELGAPPMLHRTDFESATAADYGETKHGNLITLGIDQADRTRRVRASALGRGLRSRTDIIVIDLGPMLSSTSASQLMDELDLIVMAFPKGRQPAAGLDQVARTYSAVSDRILPVVVDVPSSRQSTTSALTGPTANRTTSGGSSPLSLDAA